MKDDIADDLGIALDAVAAELPPRGDDAGFVRGLHTVPLEFIASAAVAVEELPRLQAAARFDPTDAKEMLAFVAVFRPLVEKMTALATELTFMMNSWKAQVAAGALRTYSVAKAAEDDPEVAPHAEQMRRDLGRAGRPRTRTRTTRAKTPPRFVPRPFED